MWIGKDVRAVNMVLVFNSEELFSFPETYVFLIFVACLSSRELVGFYPGIPKVIVKHDWKSPSKL